MTRYDTGHLAPGLSGRKRRLVLAPTPVAATALMMAALLVPGSTTAPAAYMSKQATKSKVYLQVANDKPTWTSYFNAIGKQLAAADGVGWTAEPYSNTTVYESIMKAAATTSKAPPLFTWWSGQQLVPMVAAKTLANLTPEVLNYEKSDGLNPQVEDAYKVNGAYYGVPMYAADWVVYYNKTVFSKYHIAVPTTWQGLMKDASLLKSHGVAPFTEYVDDWAGFIWFEQILVEQDPTAYQQLVNGKISYTSPPVVAAMEEWRTLANDGYFSTPEDIDTATPAEFVNGKQAMMLIGSWDEETLIKAGMVPGKTLGAFIMPPINPKVGWQAIFETGPFVVSAHSPQKNLAIRVLNQFMKPSTQEQWDKDTDFSPSESKVAISDPTITSVSKEITTFHVTLHNRYWEATPPAIAVTVSTDLSEFILNPNLPLMPYLRKLQSVAAAYWKSH